jgi:hypothetical protein
MYIWTNNKKLYDYVAGAGIFFNIGSFISEALLFNIFWELSRNIKKTETSAMSSFGSVCVSE